MLPLNRTNTSFFGRWWWTIDRWVLGTLVLLAIIGIFLVMAGSPAVAKRIGTDPMHFFNRHMVFLVGSFVLMMSISMVPLIWLPTLAFAGLGVIYALLVVVLFVGTQVKGASRWLDLPMGLSLQPSEFLKPLLAVVVAWLLAEFLRQRRWKPAIMLMCAVVAAVLLLVLQPDFGMIITVMAVTGGQLFLAGLPWVVCVLAVAAVVGMLVVGYLFFPHVNERITNFMSPDDEGNYQVMQSIKAFQHGGLFGSGPGEGVVKRHLPDAHTDFIFAVAGEELGAVFCLFMVLAILGVVLMSIRRIWGEKDLFIMLAVSGLLLLFSFQSFVNIGVSLHLLPTKGMTFPFISYGGSSTLASGLMAGMLLALTRRRYGHYQQPVTAL
jgi:cell division protein FtsW